MFFFSHKNFLKKNPKLILIGGHSLTFPFNFLIFFRERERERETS